MPDPIVLTAPKPIQAYLEKFLKHYPFQVEITRHDQPHIICGTQVFSAPVRAGCLLDYLRSLSEKSATADIAIGPNLLDLVKMQFQKPDGVSQTLTEKERDILHVLSGYEDGLSRSELLEKIWGYGHNIETHTLETHIYRLRQKIESNPAHPVLLVTTPDGYKINHA